MAQPAPAARPTETTTAPDLLAVNPSAAISAALEYRAQLFEAHRALDAADIPHIPVWGNMADQYGNPPKGSNLHGAKQPSISKWTPYQDRRATVQEFTGWDHAGVIGGLAIITGDVSQLVMVDLDADSDSTAPAKFAERFPDLLATYTERTPTGGLHLLYRLPPDTAAPDTIKSTIGEFRGRNVYTVIAPTRWRDMVWSVEYGDLTTIHTLTPAQLHAIMQFYGEYPPPRNETQSAARPTSSAPSNSAALSLDERTAAILAAYGNPKISADGWSEPVPCIFHQDEHPSAALHIPPGDPAHMIQYCHAGCTSTGRKPGINDRLDIERRLGLAVLHIAERPARLHRSTIEALMQQYPSRGDNLAKVVIALFAAFDAGSTFNRKDAAAACEGLIGLGALHNALETLRGLGILSGCDTVDEGIHQHTTKGTVTQAERKGRGQPAIRYTMPSGAQLAAALKVEPRGALSIPLDLLKTRTVTDILLEQRAETREGKHYYSTLEKDYGKSRRTIQRLAAENKRIKRDETIEKEIVITSREQVEALTNDPRGVRGGRKIVSAKTGREYPAFPAVAENLLAEGDSVTFIENGANYWRIDRSVTEHDADRYRELKRLRDQARRVNNRQYPLVNRQRSKLNQAHFEAIDAAFEAGNADYLKVFIQQNTPPRKVTRVCFNCGAPIRKGKTCPKCSAPAAQPAQQPDALPMAAGAENTPPAAPAGNSDSFLALAREMGARITPLERGSRANDRKSDDPPA